MNPLTPAHRPTAVLYRMVTDRHVCPFGLKARHLLRRRGYAVEDHWLRTRAETDAFKVQHDVPTTPQVFIDGRRIGGYDDLRRHFGLAVRDPKATSYTPVAVLFVITALIALAASQAAFGTPFTARAGQWFVGISMAVLALLKLRISIASPRCSSATTCWRSAGCPMPASIPLPRHWPGS
jgi:glutaredoxin